MSLEDPSTAIWPQPIRRQAENQPQSDIMPGSISACPRVSDVDVDSSVFRGLPPPAGIKLISRRCATSRIRAEEAKGESSEPQSLPRGIQMIHQHCGTRHMRQTGPP